MYSTRMSESGILLNASEKEQEQIVECVIFATEEPLRRIYECSTRELISSKACWVKSNSDYGSSLYDIARKWFYEDLRADFLYKAHINEEGMIHSIRLVEMKEAQVA